MKKTNKKQIAKEVVVKAPKASKITLTLKQAQAFNALLEKKTGKSSKVLASKIAKAQA